MAPLNFYDNTAKSSKIAESSVNDNSSIKMMSEKLERQRVDDLKVENKLGMKGNLVNKGRCPICTLKPPCKHFDSSS